MTDQVAPLVPPIPFDVLSVPPDARFVAAWRAELALARRDPWLASLVMRRIGVAGGRFGQALRFLLGLPRRLRRVLARSLALSLPAAALLFALVGQPARADTINITGTGGADCALADAITAANTDMTTGNCTHSGTYGPDTLVLVNGGTYSYTIDLPTITSPITLNANDGVIQGMSPVYSILTVVNGGLTLNDATITGGSAYFGGGIRALGSSIILSGCTITGNSAVIDGGGIYAQGSSVSISASTISDNAADSSGGGIYLGTANTVSINDSTISGNSASGGGGIFALLSDITMAGSTLDGNVATYSGGGILQSYASTSIANSTISGNSANAGGGIFHLYYLGDTTLRVANSTLSGNSAEYGAGLTLRLASADLVNSIITNSQGGGDCEVFDAGDFTGANNLIDSAVGPCSSVRIGAVSDLDPVLADNGGPTLTHMLLTGSNAIDAGSASCPGPGGGAPLAIDQRGVARPQDGDGDSNAVCDIGAVEAEETQIQFGNCNGDGGLDAADLSAIVLEIFDGDGMLPADVPGGTFPGSPTGCNANGDGQVDAGDLSCLVATLLLGPGACMMPLD